MAKEQRLEQHIETIARWIIEYKHIVAFMGAGISTDSGIPDFRGPDGVWTRRDAGLPAPQWRVPLMNLIKKAIICSIAPLIRGIGWIFAVYLVVSSSQQEGKR